MTTVAELKRVHAEGRAAELGAPNPYRGRIVLAAVWRGGYRRMLDDMLANSPARQAFLRARGATRSTETNEHRLPSVTRVGRSAERV